MDKVELTPLHGVKVLLQDVQAIELMPIEATAKKVVAKSEQMSSVLAFAIQMSTIKRLGISQEEVNEAAAMLGVEPFTVEAEAKAKV